MNSTPKSKVQMPDSCTLTHQALLPACPYWAPLSCWVSSSTLSMLEVSSEDLLTTEMITHMEVMATNTVNMKGNTLNTGPTTMPHGKESTSSNGSRSSKTCTKTSTTMILTAKRE